MEIVSQRESVAFLSSPEAFDGEGEGAAVKRIDTHLSHVFIAGDRVYKIKRAVRYDFADFSSLELRREACESEVRVNRRTAPEMYLRAAPLYRAGDGVSWRAPAEGGDARIVEWVVVMARFAAGDQFDEMLADGRVDAALVNRLADRIAGFHLNAAPKPVRRPGAALGAILDELASGLLAGALGPDRRGDILRWRARAGEEAARGARLVEARRRHGWVRACHGDLHLGNICLFNGEPTPFDAIEFNADLSDIDVLYDLAFTLMDFLRHGRRDLANLLMNRYLSATRDYAGLGLLGLYVSMRAAVRAMVSGLPGQAPEAAARAGGYLDLALALLRAPCEPSLVCVGGYSATGKSTLAGKLALEIDRDAGAVVLRSDVARKRLAGKTPETRLGPECYGAEMNDAVFRRLFRDARKALRAGRPVILDATFFGEAERAGARRLAQGLGVRFRGLWLTAPKAVLAGRIAGRRGDASDADLSVLERQFERFPPAGLERDEHWRAVDAGGAPDAVLDRALGVLRGD